MDLKEKRADAKPQRLDMKKWQAIIAEWKCSKERQKDYCKRLGINFNTFVYARGKLAKDNNKGVNPTFIPIALNRFVDERPQSAAMIIIEGQRGLKLHISPTLSLECLSKVFKLCGWQDA